MNKEKLYNELIELNILALYDFMCPIDYSASGFSAMMLTERKKDAVRRYMNDSFFRSRVKGLVVRTIAIMEAASNEK